MTTIDRITKRIDELKKSTCTKSIVDELERVKAELTAVNGVDELIQVPICNDCHKPHYGRMKVEDRCQCDTSGNFTMGEITKEQEERLKDSQPKEVPQSISREAISKKETTDEKIEKIISDMGERPFARTWETEARNMRKILRKHLSYK